MCAAVLLWLQRNLSMLNGLQPGLRLVDVLTACLKRDPAERWAPDRMLNDLLLWEEDSRLLRITMFYQVRHCSRQHCLRAALNRPAWAIHMYSAGTPRVVRSQHS
jgi:hypothetical protein